MMQRSSDPSPHDKALRRRQRERDAHRKRLTLTHRGDMVWECLATDLGQGHSILDIAVDAFLRGSSETLDLPLHALSLASPPPRLHAVLVDLRQACIDVANALPILPLGGIELASRWRHPKLDGLVTIRLNATLGARFETATFHLRLSRDV